MRHLVLSGIAVVLIGLPTFVFASVSITEIMYDLSGTDTGREWVEIYNSGPGSVDLSTYKFFENGTNHGLTVSEGSVNIGTGGYAVIADDPAKFKLDWPGFSGNLFDSSFSLSNTGETLILRDSALADVDSITYSSSQGAAGDGNSLQKGSSGWVAALPTPGGPTTETSGGGGGGGGSSSGGEVAGTSTPTSSTSAPAGGGGIWGIKAVLERPVTVVIGAPAEFSASVSDNSGNLISGANVSWSFGDGTVGEGTRVNHLYRFPGEYIVFADVSYGIAKTTGRLTLRVLPFDVSITAASREEGFVEIGNGSTQEIDIAGLRLAAGTGLFVFPPHTIILPGRKIRFSTAVTGLSLSSASQIELLGLNYVVREVFLLPPAPSILPAVLGASASATTSEKLFALRARLVDSMRLLGELSRARVQASQSPPSPLPTPVEVVSSAPSPRVVDAGTASPPPSRRSWLSSIGLFIRNLFN